MVPEFGIARDGAQDCDKCTVFAAAVKWGDTGFEGEFVTKLGD